MLARKSIQAQHQRQGLNLNESVIDVFVKMKTQVYASEPFLQLLCQHDKVSAGTKIEFVGVTKASLEPKLSLAT